MTQKCLEKKHNSRRFNYDVQKSKIKKKRETSMFTCGKL